MKRKMWTIWAIFLCWISLTNGQSSSGLCHNHQLTIDRTNHEIEQNSWEKLKDEFMKHLAEINRSCNGQDTDFCEKFRSGQFTIKTQVTEQQSDDTTGSTAQSQTTNKTKTIPVMSTFSNTTTVTVSSGATTEIVTTLTQSASANVTTASTAQPQTKNGTKTTPAMSTTSNSTTWTMPSDASTRIPTTTTQSAPPIATSEKLHEGKICEYWIVKKYLNISCSSGEIIRIVNATFGRNETAVVEPNTYDEEKCIFSEVDDVKANKICHAPKSFNITSHKCDGKQSCSLEARAEVYGDPCKRVFKRLWVQWKCENEVLHEDKVCGYKQVKKSININCSSEEIVQIIDALYGRNETAVVRSNMNDTKNCIFTINNRDGKADKTCNSTSSFTKTSEHCNGRQFCRLQADKDFYNGDPCNGIFKYLWVQWKCIRQD